MRVQAVQMGHGSTFCDDILPLDRKMNDRLRQIRRSVESRVQKFGVRPSAPIGRKLAALCGRPSYTALPATFYIQMSLPIIFLPAMPCDGRMYADQVEGLKDLASPSVQVLAHATFAESADRLLNSTTGTFILAGTAYGGCLAMEVLARAPDRVRGLWLMNCQPGVHPNPCAARKIGVRIRRGEHENVIDEFADNAIPADDIASREAFVQMARDSGAALFARQSDATLGRSDHWSTLSASKVPTLLIWGEADHLVPLDVGARIARVIPHARFEPLRGSGHFPTLERPALCTKIARDWMTCSEFP
ncbi:alpha/beta hydrolase [Paraburkholderia nemoris]|uniref:alpha/beta fold hydrolase n=1 Tax=Paraburkholderia nemoris TaxID=2793076 RepID=UPI0038B8508A